MYFITASNDYVISSITCLISYYLQLIADETTRIDDETNETWSDFGIYRCTGH